MAEITPARENLLVEETQYRSAVSEALLQKTGGSINFINNFQYDTHAFKLNGSYASGQGSTGTDGIFIVRYRMEIIAISAYSQTAGSSGTTTLDVHYLTAPNVDAGTIFSVKPSFDSTSGNNAYMLHDTLTDTDIVTGTGITNPVLSQKIFEVGEALRLDLDSAMVGGTDCGLNIHFRPVN
jgi:hypothetical protein